MTQPSSFFPDSFNLSNGPVSSVVTSQTDPRVVYDGAGLRATDAGGHLLFDLNATTGSAAFSGQVTLPEGDTGVGVQNINRLAWVDAAQVIREAFYGTLTGGTVHELWATAGARTAKLLDDANNSSFVRTIGKIGRNVEFGSNQASVNVALGYDTGITAALPSGSDQAITITHNLGVNAVNCIALGMLYDGFFSGLASWRATLGSSNAIFNIGNPSSNASVRAGLRVAFIYW